MIDDTNPNYRVFAGALAAWQYAPSPPRRRVWCINYRHGVYVPEYRGRFLRWWQPVLISDGHAEFPVVAFRSRGAALGWLDYYAPSAVL